MNWNNCNVSFKNIQNQIIFRYGIKVAGFSADGDIRLLNAMKFNSKFNVSVDKNHLFDKFDEIVCFLQDIIHIGTKLRNRLLCFFIVLIIGSSISLSLENTSEYSTKRGSWIGILGYLSRRQTELQLIEKSDGAKSP